MAESDDDHYEIEDSMDPKRVQAILLSKVIERTLKKRADISLSDKPEIKISAVVDFMKRMRVWCLDKFSKDTFVSFVTFYKTQEEMEKHLPVATILIYVIEDYLGYLIRRMGYPEPDDDDEEALVDACGTFTNIVAAKFKHGLTQIGYSELEMSHFSSYRNEILSGVEYDRSMKEKYEISFEIRGHKRIVAELVCGDIPQA